MNSHKSQATQSQVHNSCPTLHRAFRKTFTLDLKTPKDGGSTAPGTLLMQITLCSTKEDITFFHPSSVCRHCASYAFVLQIKQPSTPINLLPKQTLRNHDRATSSPSFCYSKLLELPSRLPRGTAPGCGAEAPTAPPALSSPAPRRRPYPAPRATEPAKQVINSGN